MDICFTLSPFTVVLVNRMDVSSSMKNALTSSLNTTYHKIHLKETFHYTSRIFFIFFLNKYMYIYISLLILFYANVAFHDPDSNVRVLRELTFTTCLLNRNKRKYSKDFFFSLSHTYTHSLSISLSFSPYIFRSYTFSLSLSLFL